MSKQELTPLPCPLPCDWCGSELLISDNKPALGYMVQCNDCGAHMVGETEEQAIKAWNTRA